MGTITIKNLSTFSDYAAIIRVATFIAGDEHFAKRNDHGKEVVTITCKGNTYTVTDKEADT